MAHRKKIELFVEVNTEKEFYSILNKNKNTLICAEIYCEFAGYCVALDRLFTTIKLDWSDGKLILLRVLADAIEVFQRFRGLSEPMFVFIHGNKITKVFRGVDAIKLSEVAKKELDYFKKLQAGEDIERRLYDLDEATPEEQQWHAVVRADLDKEQATFEEARSTQLALRKKRRAELMVPHLENLNFVLFWPHARHAHVELYERWDLNNVIMVGREELELDEYKARDILYAGDAPLNEASMHALLAGSALAICFRFLGSGTSFVSLVRRILYEDIPPLDPAKSQKDQPIQKTAFDQYKSFSPTREEIWRKRREDRIKYKEELKERRARRLSEMQRLARQAIEAELEARRNEKEKLKLDLLKSGNLAALEELKQQPDNDEVDIVVPEALSDEEDVSEGDDVEDENEYFPPPGLLVPAFYAPPNDIAKTNGLAILFPKLVCENVTPEPEFLPPHVLVMLQIEKRYKAIAALAKHRPAVIHMGIFKGTGPSNAVHIAYSVKQYDSLTHDMNEKLIRLAFMVSMQTDLPLLELMELSPAYVSRDASAGERECVKLFPVYYCHEQEFEDFAANKDTEATVYPTLLLLLAGATLGGCVCPREWMHGLGNCSYQIHCQGDLRGLRLSDECHNSNYPVNVTLTVDSPLAFDENTTNVDPALLASVTSFRAIGKWPQPRLAIVEYMYGLTELYLPGNQIERIEGAPFFNLAHLETVDLSDNNLTEIEGLLLFEMQPNKLRKLSLAYNAIENIPDDAFDQVTSLEELDLSNNLVHDLNNKTFSKLTRLETLKLSNNKITYLDGAINTLKGLKHLYLRGNLLQNIDMQSLHIINHLETFDVSANHLEKLTPDWFLRHVRHFGSHSTFKIVLSENYITSLQNALSQDKKTRFNRKVKGKNYDVPTEVDLSKNIITDIEPYALQYIAHLTSLDLSHNKLISFVINADDLKHVKYLNLSNNYIGQLPYESFKSMNDLQNLDLSFNKLDSLPDQTFANNFILRYVNMSNNYFEKLNKFGINMFHPDGGVLDLSNNGLSSLKVPYGEGLRLKFLTLHSNNISDASLIELSYQNDLKFLDLSDNYIEDLNDESLRLPSSLWSLDLTYNHIMNVGPSTFKTLGRLNTLRLSHNLLETIEYGAFSSLTTLSHLDLSHNHIEFLDSKVLMDLKSLKLLSLRFNHMQYLDYKGWIGHKSHLRVNIDGNDFSCTWLATALSDFNNGFSDMEPVVAVTVTNGPSIEGIPCVNKVANQVNVGSTDATADERLLVITSKILDAIKEQTRVIKTQHYHAPSYH